MNNPLKVLHIVPSINVLTGGPAYSVSRIVDELARRDVDVTLATLDYAHLGEQLPVERARFVSCPARFFAIHGRGFAPKFSRRLFQLAEREGFDLVHNHGLWMFQNWYAYRTARRIGAPVICSPRGMLEPWALQRGSWKKSLIWRLLEKGNLQSVSLFHATSDQEARSIKKAGFSSIPISVVPIGVDPPSANGSLDYEELVARFPELEGKKFVLFLSRLHPKKGIDLLLRSWQALHNEFPDWHLVLAGPDLVGYRRRIDQLVADWRLTSVVTLPGPVSGALKSALLGFADLFVLPSHSENFGITVAEALVHGTPALTTHGTPWQVLRDENFGWWIPLSEDVLRDALRTALSLGREERAEMGRRGQEYALRHLSWPSMAEKLLETYRWLLEPGDLPESIHLGRTEAA